MTDFKDFARAREMWMDFQTKIGVLAAQESHSQANLHLLLSEFEGEVQVGDGRCLPLNAAC